MHATHNTMHAIHITHKHINVAMQVSSACALDTCIATFMCLFNLVACGFVPGAGYAGGFTLSF